MEAGGNGDNQWDGKENGNKTRLNLGIEMGMSHWEWEGMGLKKTFPLIFTVNVCNIYSQIKLYENCKNWLKVWRIYRQIWHIFCGLQFSIILYKQVTKLCLVC